MVKEILFLASLGVQEEKLFRNIVCNSLTLNR